MNTVYSVVAPTGATTEVQQKEKINMSQTRTLTVSETAKLVGVTINTVYKDIQRGALFAYRQSPMRFAHPDVTEYRLTKVEQFFDSMEEFRGRTKVNATALAAAFEVDPSLFSHWKRGTSLPQGSTMLKANQILNGTDSEVVKRIIDKLDASKLDYKGVAMLNKLTKIFRDLPVSDNGNGTTSAWVVGADKELAEKAKAAEAEKGQHKYKREHTSNVLDSTMRHNIIDWMYRTGKSNSYVARMLGVSSGAVAGWLRGKNINMPNLRKIEALCREQHIPIMSETAIEIGQPVVQDVDRVEDDDEVIEDGGISEEREAFLIRTHELALYLFQVWDRARRAQRELEEHLEGEYPL